MKYIALLRGVNVGGKNKVSMSELVRQLSGIGWENVSTYINSGNIVFYSKKTVALLRQEIQQLLQEAFELDTKDLKVNIITHAEIAEVIKFAPQDFGKEPGKYKYDIAFVIGGSGEEAIKQFTGNQEVDSFWPGATVVYYRRLTEKLTKSRISKIVSMPIYQRLTVRNWNTVNRLHEMTSK
ncbi:DUF1697 domain-containing protein [Patescibacteria group bacterium]|nr:MAG: DUF1697 domain-containing protein [Patescibacteria group bacterium]